MTAQQRARRIRAARELAGFRTPEAFATVAPASYATLRKWENENHEQELPDFKLKALAEACGLPVEFFYVDMFVSRQTDPGAEHERVLEGHVRISQQPADSNGSDTHAQPPGD